MQRIFLAKTENCMRINTHEVGALDEALIETNKTDKICIEETQLSNTNNKIKFVTEKLNPLVTNGPSQQMDFPILII